MGITSALYSGVSGLNTNSQAMSVIGNNLANTNTLGFKGARTVFSDLLSSNVSGSGGKSQIGRGVGLSTVDNVFSQGTFESTSSDTDVAIEGEGFFLLKQPAGNSTYYSRAGAFRFDNAGFLVNPEGMRVQGKGFDTTGMVNTRDPTDIQVTNVGLIGAKASSELTFTTNLDENSAELGAGAIDPANRATYNYTAPGQVYDSLGQPHLLSVYWRLVDNATNEWAMAYTTDGDPATLANMGNLSFDANGNLADLDGDGTADPVEVALALPDWGNGSVVGQPLTLVFDCTQYDSASDIIGTSQDGYGAGELTNVAINGEGIVVASYSNGRQINISQLVLAKFQNPGGLQLLGSNHYKATAEAGTIRVGLPGSELGKVFTNSLEQSNVDMGQEFVKMITTQRGFQANSKIITTVDEMLSELINLKR
ncbi:MAG: flagellar hook protein FlgE [Desulfobulbus sp.]|jgi:flagellar hook protein FlgE|nr:flagellar hook protein FlgE [Desulfobulbus sp.]